MPKPKQKKSILTGRVGVSAEKRKAAIFVDVREKKMKTETIIEEHPSFDIFDLYDIPMYEVDDEIGTKKEDAVKEEEHEVRLLKDIEKLPDEEDIKHDDKNIKKKEETNEDKVIVLEEENVLLKKKNENKENLVKKGKSDSTKIDDNDDDIVILKAVGPTGTKRKKRKLIFSIEEKDTILNKHMLTDESINIAQNLLKQQFPQIHGFQDTVIGKTQCFDVIGSKSKFVQILHAGSLHWVTVANMDDEKNSRAECYLYDSLSSGKVSTDIAKQIAAFSFCESAELLVNVMPVQQQGNSVDCGVFAIAFATSLSFGENPCNITFDIKEIRKHLVTCLERIEMSPFPRNNSKRSIKCQPSLNTIEIYCSCRMPYDKNGEDMVECSNCQEWYHISCENVSQKVFESRNRNWYCKSCKQTKKN